MSQWYAKFIKNYADICEPLYNLKRKLKRFIWLIEAQKAFDAVKAAITKVPVLKFPDFKKPFELFTDVSSIGVGAVLNQEQRPVLLVRLVLRREIKRMIRWALKLAEFNIEWEHRPRTQNTIADVLSRNPIKNIIGEKVNSAMYFQEEFCRFHTDIFDVKDAPRIGRRHVSSRSITQKQKINYKMVLNHLHKAGLKKKLDRGEVAQTVAKPELTARKVLLCIWWDCKGIIYYDLLPYGQTLNSDLYCQLDHLKPAID
ncbi:putative DD34D transposase [Trichonephila clavipes]|nr:putative DD34D transposase [Trichonephila clavipes]